MALQDDIRAYLDADGLVAQRPTIPGQRNASGNGVLYTALYFICLAVREEAGLIDRGQFLDLTDILWKREDGRSLFGLLVRGPAHPDQQAMDDYTGWVAAAAMLVCPAVPRAILRYGETAWVRGLLPWPVRFFYSNVSPGSARHLDGRKNWNAWLGRYPQFVPLLRMASGVNGFLGRLLWSLSLAYSSLTLRPEDQDGWILSYLHVRVANLRLGTRLATRLFQARLKRVHPTGVREPLKNALHAADDPEPAGSHPVYLAWPLNDLGPVSPPRSRDERRSPKFFDSLRPRVPYPLA